MALIFHMLASSMLISALWKAFIQCVKCYLNPVQNTFNRTDSIELLQFKVKYFPLVAWLYFWQFFRSDC